MDDDLAVLSREQLLDEVKRLRARVRAHRDSTRHEPCWHHPALWGLLPEKPDPIPVVPERPEFMRGCIRYRGIAGPSGTRCTAHTPKQRFASAWMAATARRSTSNLDSTRHANRESRKRKEMV